MRNKITEILTEIRPECDFGKPCDFIADGMLDSFDIVTLVTELDKTFSISIDGTEILPENFQNLDAIESLLQKHGVGR
jgi:acyl carrier protein